MGKILPAALLIPTLHLPAHTFVFGHLWGTTKRVHVAGEVSQLIILEGEVVRWHRGPIEPGEDTPEDVARDRPTLEWSLGKVGRFHRKGRAPRGRLRAPRIRGIQRIPLSGRFVGHGQLPRPYSAAKVE
ncbi:MAG: hypothetical protein O7G28_05710 [Deltaproteobacteria bacterium]|nr:hypothetical protein [Deltaproteobacteria bacterium]